MRKGVNRIGQDGIALLVVLWVMAVLTVIVAQFCHSMRFEIKMTGNFRDSVKAYYQARAGVEKGLLRLFTDMVQGRGNGNEDESGNWRINADNPMDHLGDGFFQVWLNNSGGYVNINKASPQLLRMVLSGLELNENEKDVLVDSIMDWRDTDNFHRLNGAENEYYQHLAKPYSCGNGPFRSLEELLLVRGMTKDIFTAVQHRLTIYPVEKYAGKTSKTGSVIVVPDQKKININAATPEVLAILPEMTQAAVENIVDFRRTRDFSSLAEVKEIVGDEIYNSMSNSITLKTTSCYLITSVGKVDGSRVSSTVKVVVDVNHEKKTYNIIKWQDSP